MSKKKDLISLGEAYADVFNKVVVSENVPVGEIGNADLVTKDTGPTERGGFRPAKIDIDRMSEKDKKDNIYNIKGYTYGDGNDPGDCDGPDPTGPTYAQVAYTGNVGPEEDEEETEKEKSYKERWGKDLDKQREREGSSNAGDYSDVDKDDFCGPAGGAAPGTYPCDTIDRARSALRLAYNAPDPEGIKRCVYKKFPKLKDNKSEEDEEFLEEHEKIARDGLNNFMSKTSVFDKLYNKVMVNENFPHEGQEEFEDVTELEALGVETEVDEVPEEITVSIPGALAQELCDILQTALAQQEVEVDVDVDVEEVTDTEFEEDEEAVMKDGGGYGIDAGSTLKKEVNYGKNNKVGNLKPVAGGPKMKDGGGYGIDAGSTLKHEVNYGKNNKVGTLKVGKNAFEQ
jgi:hypothetical protein